MDELNKVFRQEAAVLLDDLEDLVIKYEEDDSNTDIPLSLMRVTHTLKGSSATAGLSDVSELAHAMEDLFQAVVDGVLLPMPVFFDQLNAVTDHLREQLLMNGQVDNESIREHRDQLQNWFTTQSPAPPQPGAPTDPADERPEFEFGEYDYLKIKALREKGLNLQDVSLDIAHIVSCEEDAADGVMAVLGSAGNTVASSPPLWDVEAIAQSSVLRCLMATEQTAEELSQRLRTNGLNVLSLTPFTDTAPGAKEEATEVQMVTDRTLRVDIEHLNDVLRFAGELVGVETRVRTISGRFRNEMDAPEFAEKLNEATALLNRLASSLQMSVLHARMTPCFRSFRELRRTIRAVSRQAGKTVSVSFSGGEYEVDKGVMDLLIQSFKDYVTNLVAFGETSPDHPAGEPPRIFIGAMASGNIVSFAVESSLFPPEEVVEKTRMQIQQTGGSVIYDQVTTGTGLRFMVPTTLTILPVMLFRVADEVYGIALNEVIETLKLNDEDLDSVCGGKVMDYRGRPMAICELDKQLGTPTSLAPRFRHALVVRDGAQPLALQVDNLIGKQDVVIKPLVGRLSSIAVLKGATILGNGVPALLLNVSSLIAGFEQQNLAVRMTTPAIDEQEMVS